MIDAVKSEYCLASSNEQVESKDVGVVLMSVTPARWCVLKKEAQNLSVCAGGRYERSLVRSDLFGPRLALRTVMALHRVKAVAEVLSQGSFEQKTRAPFQSSLVVEYALGAHPLAEARLRSAQKSPRPWQSRLQSRFPLAHPMFRRRCHASRRAGRTRSKLRRVG